MQAPIALPRCFAEILCPDFGFGSLREFHPRCRSFTVIHQVLPQNCASSVRKIYSQITLVQLCGIALTPVSLYFLVWRRPETGDRFENRERQRFFSTVWEHSVLLCRNLYAVPDTVLLHIRATLRRRGIAVPRNPLARYTAWHLRIRRLVQFILAGAVYHNALTSCATRVCCACLDEITCVAVRYLKLRTGCERHGRKNPLPFPYFEAVAALRFPPGYQARER